ncbi:MAG: hypothetical protein ACXVMS_16785 [Flavisolibacter sp.]
MKQPFSTPGFLWPLLTLISLLSILAGMVKLIQKSKWSQRRKQGMILITILSLSLWITMLTILSLKGVFSDFTKLPPRPVLLLLFPLPFVLAFVFSRTGKDLLHEVPAHWLVFFQTFRILVEIWLWFAFLSNKLPVQMTFEGRNLDLLTGVFAIPAGFFIQKRTTYAFRAGMAFNIIGILLLLNVLVVSFLSLPTPFRLFMNEPSAQLIGSFPFILLPGVLVPLAYTFHICSIRQLLLIRKNNEELKIFSLLTHEEGAEDAMAPCN